MKSKAAMELEGFSKTYVIKWVDLDAIRAGTKSGITWQDADKPVVYA